MMRLSPFDSYTVASLLVPLADMALRAWVNID